MLEARSPASSLLDLATLGLMPGDLTAPAALPSAQPRVSAPSAGFEPTADRPLPVVSEKMADAQPAAEPEPTSSPERHPLDDELFVTFGPAVGPLSGPVLLAANGQIGGAQAETGPAQQVTVAGTPLADFVAVPTVAAPHTTAGVGFYTPPPDGGYPSTKVDMVKTAVVRDMDFHGNIVVQADPGRTAYPQDPEYRDASMDGTIDLNSPLEWVVPVAYVRNTKPVVSAVFKVEWHAAETGGNPGTGQVYVRSQMGAFTIPQTEATRNGDFVTLPPTAAQHPLQDIVHVSGGIAWEVGTKVFGTGAIEWVPAAGYCGNQLYVTLAQPAAGNPVYHTLISLSTVWGAQTAAAVVNGTYQQFTYRSIQSVVPAHMPLGSDSAVFYGGQPLPLHYYKSWETKQTDTFGLLFTGDGQCNSWAHLFRDAVRVQGDIPVLRVGVEPVDNKVDQGFAVSLWDFAGPATYPGGTHPYRNILRADGEYEVPDGSGGWKYDWRAGRVVEFADMEGAGGQNTLNPRSIFQNHYINSYDDGTTGTKFYDPSYGSGPFLSFPEWEDQSISALIQLGTSADGLNEFRFRPNLAAADLKAVAQ